MRSTTEPFKETEDGFHLALIIIFVQSNARLGLPWQAPKNVVYGEIKVQICVDALAVVFHTLYLEKSSSWTLCANL